MSTPTILEMETSPETANYRKSRLVFWAQIYQKRDDYRASALKHGATKPQAEEAAGRDARSEVRWLIGDLLTHTPGERAANFITAAPREWGQRAEILLDADPVVPDLIAHAYPVTSWAAKLDTLTKQVAADDAAWQRWIERMLPALSPFGVTHDAMSSVFGLVDMWAEASAASARASETQPAASAARSAIYPGRSAPSASARRSSARAI